MVEILNDPILGQNVMPLLRPCGRIPTELDPGGHMDTIFGKRYGTVPCAVPIVNGRLGLCELWLQVSDDVASEVWSKVTRWVDDNGHGCAWSDGRTVEQRLWQPFGSNSSDQYVQGALRSIRKAQNVIRLLTDDEKAWLLKVVWYRGSVEVGRFHERKSGRCLQSPNEAADLMKDVLGNIQLQHFGFSSCRETLDPTEIWTSHMSAYAVNALMPLSTSPQPCCDLLEKCCNGSGATRPFDVIEQGYVNDRQEYLTMLRLNADWTRL